MNIQAVNNQTNSLIDSYVYAPFRNVAKKIRDVAERVFGFILRVVIFQLGEMKEKGAYTVMRCYQRLFSYDPREEKPIDFERLEQSKNFLLSYGGKEEVVKAIDGGSEIHLITFSSKGFYDAFAKQGSYPIKIDFQGKERRVLLDPPKGAAEKFYFPIIHVNMSDGTKRKGALLPESCPAQNPPHILHSHSPGRSMSMDRKLVGQHLAAGYDLTIWDPRGTIDSKGRPSEGGYYLDIDAVYQHLRKTIPANRIYASGFCEGAAMAAYLKKQYHQEGLHFIASNPYTNIKEVVEGYGWLGRIGAHYGMKAIQDPNLKVEQDFFNNIEKLKNLPKSDGKCILIHTDTDEMMPRGTVSKMFAAFGHAGPHYEILRVHPNMEENGHLQPPYEDPVIWHRYIHVVN